MILRVILILFTLLLLGSLNAQSNPVDNFYKIYELAKGKLGLGTYQTQGYVVRKYSCPPCPQEGVCQPCMPDYVVISDNLSLDADIVIYPQLRFFVEDADLFEEGKEYKWLIQILDVKSIDQTLNNIKLIHSEKIEVPVIVEKIEVLEGNSSSTHVEAPLIP
jgi:hypothetical protein